MELTLSLCDNCTHAANCVLRNGQAVLQCEEHEMAEEPEVFAREEPILTKPERELKHYRGLCNNCELATNCSWRNPETVVFHCEHYL